MIEIRPIRHDEGDQFLRLMCSVFDLDFGRARSVFYTEPYFDLNRKWALLVEDRIVSILTTTPMLFGWGRAIGIAGVATAPDAQRSGFAEKLIRHVLQRAEQDGERASLLFAKDERLYARLGFETVDTVFTGELACSNDWEAQPAIEVEEVQALYDHWALQDPNRLIRDDRRWRLWKWNFRVCASFQDGYIASEPNTLREALFSKPAQTLPLPSYCRWTGLSGMAEYLQLPLLSETFELHFMTRNCKGVPLMFMTDQF